MTRPLASCIIFVTAIVLLLAMVGPVSAAPAPSFTSITPKTGPTSGGTNVVIRGTNFATGVTVTIGGVAATNVIFINATYITATTPAGTLGAKDVVITNTDSKKGTGTGAFTYVAPAAFSSITPNTGLTTGGTAVTIYGTNFIGTTGVTFGGTAATGISVINYTAVSATAPAHAAGAVNVVITTPNGTATGTNAFTYVVPPAFTSLTPTSGPTTGGTAVTIYGTNFIGTTGVTFGGSAAIGFSVINYTAVLATPPAHAAGAVNVVITTPNGTATGTNAFTYIASNVAITLNQTSIFMPLTAGGTATNTSLGITVTANIPFTVTVADNTGRITNVGYMGNYTTGYVLSPLNTKLASPLGLAGTTNSTTAMKPITPPITSTAQSLYSGSAAVTSQLLAPNTFTQPVALTDPVLPVGSKYRIDLIFTIAAS